MFNSLSILFFDSTILQPVRSFYSFSFRKLSDSINYQTVIGIFWYVEKHDTIHKKIIILLSLVVYQKTLEVIYFDPSKYTPKSGFG